MPRLAKHNPYLEDALAQLLEEHRDDAFVLLFEVVKDMPPGQMSQHPRLAEIGQDLKVRKQVLNQLNRRNP